MKATIKSIRLENFKGIKDQVFEFDGKSSAVTGKNASGKTTIATAFMWLFTDKDIDLKSNPNVKPLGVEECTPTVSVIMDIDGKQVEFTKAQKIKKSKPDENGICKFSSTNTYMINAVPKTERDFKAYLVEVGMPTDSDFLMMCHTDVFTSMKQADMRKILFGMVGEVTDQDIAAKTSGVDDLKALLENYKLDEIEAMQKASKKKSDEELKNIPGQIEGLELAKTEDTDTAEQELLIKSLQEQMATEQAKADQIREEKNRFSNLCTEGLQLDFDRNSELQKMNDKANEGRKDIESQLINCHNDMVDLKRKVNSLNADVTQTQAKIDDNNRKFEGLKAEYNIAKESRFDDSELICPTCGQTYTQEKQDEIKANFEKNKKTLMDNINHQAKDVSTETKRLESNLADYTKEFEQAKLDLESCENKAKALEQQLENFKPTEVEPTAELKVIDEKIAEINKAKEEIKSHNNDECLVECNSKIAGLQNQLNEANKVIGASSNNIRIDEQIQELSEKRMQLEQAKADAEKILYQIDLLSKAKNETLTAEINKHFLNVKFVLFEYLKNGSYQDVCVPMTLDDKPLGVATNTALELAIKIEICEAFQQFNGVELPIFVDQAECLDTKSYNDIKPRCQHIYLAVSDSDLTVKKGE